MAKTYNNLAHRLHAKRKASRSPKGSVSVLKGGYQLRIAHRLRRLNRSKEAKRRARLQEAWGQHVKALDALIVARERSRSLIRIVNTCDARAELDAKARAMREEGNVKLGWHMHAESHVTYARFKLAPVKDKPERDWPIVKAYHRTPKLGGAATSKRFTNGRDVWACYQVA